MSVFIRLQQAEDVAAVRELGVKVGTKLGDLLTAQFSLPLLPQLVALDGVESVQMGRRVHLSSPALGAGAGVLVRRRVGW